MDVLEMMMSGGIIVKTFWAETFNNDLKNMI